MQAQDRIHHQRYNPDDWEGVYGLYMSAYGDKSLAEEAMLSVMQAVVRRDTEAARRKV